MANKNGRFCFGIGLPRMKFTIVDWKVFGFDVRCSEEVHVASPCRDTSDTIPHYSTVASSSWSRARWWDGRGLPLSLQAICDWIYPPKWKLIPRFPFPTIAHFAAAIVYFIFILTATLYNGKEKSTSTCRWSDGMDDRQRCRAFSSTASKGSYVYVHGEWWVGKKDVIENNATNYFF